MIEIERKFLVNVDKLLPPTTTHKIKQGYLSTDPKRTVRVRISNRRAYLTVKGESTKDGLSRFEYEREIYKDEAEELMTLCTDVIEKERLIIPYGEKVWEVDIFQGDNHGLVIAEIELTSETEQFETPPFVTTEVTGLTKYYNSALGQNPFKNW